MPKQTDTALENQMQAKVYHTVTWYQPKYTDTHTYTGVRRFQKSDNVQGYAVYSTAWATLNGITSCKGSSSQIVLASSTYIGAVMATAALGMISLAL